MDKFKIKHPTNADFEEKLAKYAKLADDVWRQASIAVNLTAALHTNFRSCSPKPCAQQASNLCPTYDCILVRLGSMRAFHTCKSLFHLLDDSAQCMLIPNS